MFPADAALRPVLVIALVAPVIRVAALIELDRYRLAAIVAMQPANNLPPILGKHLPIQCAPA